MFFANLMNESPSLPPADFGGALLRMLTALLILLALLALTYWILKRLIRYRQTKGSSTQAI
ncbi:MAG: hypothetical protein HY324_02425, partial [Chlamydiia bacterium]|nr:hypothetical protein [Chlamydiia bacterium]